MQYKLRCWRRHWERERRRWFVCVHLPRERGRGERARLLCGGEHQRKTSRQARRFKRFRSLGKGDILLTDVPASREREREMLCIYTCEWAQPAARSFSGCALRAQSDFIASAPRRFELSAPARSCFIIYFNSPPPHYWITPSMCTRGVCNENHFMGSLDLTAARLFAYLLLNYILISPPASLMPSNIGK